MAEPREVISGMLDRPTAGGATPSELLPMVYDQLRSIAARSLRDQRPGHTLQATALVHEAYLKLVDQTMAWSGKAQFFVVAARAMRSILVDHARARNCDKRSGGRRRVPLSEDAISPESDDLPIEAIDAALSKLSELDERKARLVELRFFGGLTLEDAADVLGLARSTAFDDWRLARAWLHDQLLDEAT